MTKKGPLNFFKSLRPNVSPSHTVNKFLAEKEVSRLSLKLAHIFQTVGSLLLITETYVRCAVG